eukprot:TRINITY_DN30_c0_g1_i2.p1 TRINITY_DN30_c0_g1~~TRINITY_DN30_c0_g1_i2.p1  ORF type:complete len:120 (+),score=39.45 TRINITY_DN30_c0_g1_i2:120-479(+)
MCIRDRYQRRVRGHFILLMGEFMTKQSVTKSRLSKFAVVGVAAGLLSACGPSVDNSAGVSTISQDPGRQGAVAGVGIESNDIQSMTCLLYTSDAADDLLCVDLGGRRIIKKKKKIKKNK